MAVTDPTATAPAPLAAPPAAPASAATPADIVRVMAWALVVCLVMIVGAFVFVIIRDGNSPLVSQAMDALVKIALGSVTLIVALIGGARFVDAMASKAV